MRMSDMNIKVVEIINYIECGFLFLSITIKEKIHFSEFPAFMSDLFTQFKYELQLVIWQLTLNIFLFTETSLRQAVTGPVASLDAVPQAEFVTSGDGLLFTSMHTHMRTESPLWKQQSESAMTL